MPGFSSDFFFAPRVRSLHQFKVIDEAQKMFVVREMMPKDIKREFLTGPRKFDEIMEITVNEMIADDGPEPMDLGNVGTRDAEWFGHEQRHVIRRRLCDRLERVQSRQGSRNRTDQGRGIVEKELMNGRVSEEITEERQSSKGSKPDWNGDKDKREREKQRQRQERNPILLLLRRARATSEWTVHTGAPTA